MNTYMTIAGDTWDSISYKVYESEYFIKELIQANPKYIHIKIFEGGIVLNIPVIDNNKKADITPPWAD